MNSIYSINHSTQLVTGVPPVSLASHCILAVLLKAEQEEVEETVFHKLGVFQSVTQKVQELCAAERSSISRPAKDARELLNKLEG